MSGFGPGSLLGPSGALGGQIVAAGRGLPARILVHVATPLLASLDPDASEWVEGERGEAGPSDRVAGEAFAAVLFLPEAPEGEGGEQSWRPRTVTRPTLLYNLRREDESLVVLPKEARLSIAAPDLAVVLHADVTEWQLDGDPEPMGKPGAPFAARATLKRVSD